MTPIEIRDALRMLRSRVGREAFIDLTISPNGGKPITGVIYPDGIIKDCAVRIEADDWPEAITLMNERWNVARDSLQAEKIKAMALAIIRLIAEQGACTDRALRCEFDDADVIAYGERAAELANSMAANGPFSITRDGAANEAPAPEHERAGNA